MDLAHNSWEEVLVAVIALTAFSILSLRNIEQIGIDVADQTVVYYYLPLFGSSFMILLAGPGWYAAVILAVGNFMLGSVVSYRSGLLRVVPSFPLFSRVFCYMTPIFPVAGLSGYYLFAPWGGPLEWWLAMAFLFSFVVAALISWYQLRRHYPPQKEK